MHPTPVTLTGRSVRLEPLSDAHASDLLAAAEPDLFRLSAIAPPTWDAAGFRAYIDRLRGLERSIPFAVVLLGSGRAIGSTSYLDIQPAHRALEIGFTWIGCPYQGTRVNPEMKLLLLRHAFEELAAVRVQLKTDARNAQSVAAMEKLGLVREGVLRRHRILPDGFVRDTVMFSVVDDEWPALRMRIEERLARLGEPGAEPGRPVCE